MRTLPNGWEFTTVGAVTLPIEVETPAAYPEKQFRYIDIGAIDNKHFTVTAPKEFLGRDAPSRARRIVRTGDVLFSTVRTHLKNIAVVPASLDGALASTGIAVLRPSPAIESKYLFYWACSDPFVSAISLAQDGTMYPAVSDRDVFAGAIPLAPIEEQRRIVRELDDMVGRIARAAVALDEIPDLISQQRRALLREATDGTLTREWREAGELPKWTKTTISAVSQSLFDGPFGSNLKSADYVDAGVRVVRLENIGHLKFLGEKEAFVSVQKYEALSRHALQESDILFSSFISDEIRVCLFPAGLSPAINKADCFCIRVQQDLCDPAFITFRLATQKTLEDLKDLIHGSTRPRVTLRQLRDYEFKLPSLPEQREIVRRLEIEFSRLDEVERQHQDADVLLPRLREAVVAKAFGGELNTSNSNDQPISTLLDEVRVLREAQSKRKTKSSPKRGTVLDPYQAIKLDAANWPAEGLSFEEIRRRVTGDYESVQGAIFALLEGQSPTLRQHFDKTRGVMRIRRAAG